ncbi:M67 family metallopeptidase [Halobacillus litoralis]|uniref:M67 family metallopeptidase n=1 Tax=Halobacillus litoralis TaxID=45668 RepID=UPI0035322E22
MESIVKSPVSFEMDVNEIREVFRWMDRNDETLTGIYHSHPTAAPHPSVDDIRNAYYPNAAYFIVSFAYKEPVVKCFYIRDAKVIPLIIKPY